jgi:cell division septation protein DedD
MSAPYEFSITKGRMVQLVVCIGVIQVLLYSSGVATGLLLGPKGATTYPLAKVRDTPTQVLEKTKPLPVAEKQTAPSVSAPPAAEASASSTNPATKPQTGEPQTDSSPAAQAQQPSPAGAQSSQPGGLAIQVASFHMKSNAVRLADILEREGYGPVTVGESGNGSDIWHFVQIGPYKEWDEASRVVAELDRSYSVHAYVRPIRATFN